MEKIIFILLGLNLRARHDENNDQPIIDFEHYSILFDKGLVIMNELFGRIGETELKNAYNITATPEKLKRAKNIQQNPSVALLIDEYNKDWTKLFYFIMIQGRASIMGKELEQQNELLLLEKAHKLLSDKYLQYQKIGIGEYVIMIIPQKVITWKNRRLIC